MCVIALAWRADAARPLVLAANRDERHDRPAAPLHRWSKAPGVLAGKDLAAGGTWLGVAEDGRLAALTNVRGDLAPDRPSRGALVSRLLLDPGAALLDDLGAFNGLNLLQVSGGRATVWSNRPIACSVLEPGVYAFANDRFDRPTPRTERLRAQLRVWLEARGELDALLELLADDAPAQGAPLFVRHPVYGTRCSTVLKVDAAGRGEVHERSFDADGQPTGEVRHAFTWPSSAFEEGRL